jgi:hypothetical protein
MRNAIAKLYLVALQQELNALPAPSNNWYFDWIMGALVPVAGLPRQLSFQPGGRIHVCNCDHIRGSISNSLRRAFALVSAEEAS